LAEYLVNCWNCLGEFDALKAVWCSCNPNHPTKVCPFCLNCFCGATEDFKERFWRHAPKELLEDREMLAKSRGPLGEALVRAKAITADQLLQALKRQRQRGGRLGEVLVDMGFITPDTLQVFLSRQKAVTQLSLKNLEVDADLISLVGVRECAKRKVLPVSKESLSTKEILTLAMANPSDGAAIDYVQSVTGCQILPMHAKEEEIRKCLEPYLKDQPMEKPREEPPGNQLSLDLIRKALKRNASDLYVEPREDQITIHLRIDGILYRAKSIPKDLQGNLVSEMKRLVKLDPSVTNQPQEGRVVMRSGQNRFEIIAQLLPTRFGENLSLKIINRDTFLKTFDQLGLGAGDQLTLRTALMARSGLILVTAPLFYGSTTTLYSIMNNLAMDPSLKVMSIEPQSICPVPNVSQVTMGKDAVEGSALTILKAATNIQPDVCIMGGLLDIPGIAAQLTKLASQMLVVATLDANSCVSSVKHLLDMAVSPTELSRHLLLVLNQRLVRRICDGCREPVPLSQNTLRLMGLSAKEAADLNTVYQGQGCPKCAKIGYHGRLALFEILTPNASFRKALARKASDQVLEREAVKADMIPLRERMLEAVSRGKTTLEELQKGNF